MSTTYCSTLHDVLFYCSCVILGIFEVELLNLLVAMDVRFFLNPFYAVSAASI